MKKYLKHFLMWTVLLPVIGLVAFAPLIIADLTGHVWWMLIYLFVIVAILANITASLKK